MQNTKSRFISTVLALCLSACAQIPGGTGPATTTGSASDSAARSDPSDTAAAKDSSNGISSLFKKAFSNAIDGQIPYAYYLSGIPPRQEKYYCLMNPRTGEKKENAVLGAMGANPISGAPTFRVTAVSILSCARLQQAGNLVLTKEGENAALKELVEINGASMSILDTKLYRILANHPATSSAMPEWPRVAISRMRVPQYQTREVLIQNVLTNSECIYFDATLWIDQRRSESLKNVSVCGADFARLKQEGYDNQSAVRAWMNMPIPGKTTGQVRTPGPIPPSFGLSADDMNKIWTEHLYGYAFLGQLLHTVGYDPRFDTRRFWLVGFAQ